MVSTSAAQPSIFALGALASFEQKESTMPTVKVAKPSATSNYIHSDSQNPRPQPLLPVEDAAAFLGGISKSWLDKSRLNGRGPRYVKIGRRVMYDLIDLQAWLAGQKQDHTSDLGGSDT
jgi:predicted DNA-binding transcriptional regulator AlpA